MLILLISVRFHTTTLNRGSVLRFDFAFWVRVDNYGVQKVVLYLIRHWHASILCIFTL